MKKESRRNLKCLSLDRGSELISNEFNKLNTKSEIKRQVLTPSTPQKNGIEERRNRSIIDCARTLMIEKNVAIK